MSDIEFVKGMIPKAPRSGAPDFVKLSLSIKRDEFLDWLGDQDGDWINISVKEAKSGKWYAAVDSWKPNSEQSDRPKRQTSQRDEIRGNNPPRDALGRDQTPDFAEDEIPF